MKYAFVADIHGNLDALEAVLAVIDKDGGIDTVCCAGDVVGYGAQPSECLSVIRERGWPVVAGNHDWAAAGMMNLEYFNPTAKEAIEWTAGMLSREEKEFLSSQPLVLERESFVMVHGTLYEPGNFGYVLSELDARVMFKFLQKDFCFSGHSHYPCIFIEGDDLFFTRDAEVTGGDEEKVIVNVGSVGQPRDSDPRACLVFYDADTRAVSTVRIAYDIETAADKIVDAGLPKSLADRLFLGT